MSSPNALSAYKLLPRTNCRDCGRPSCMAFAHALVLCEASAASCPHLDEAARAALEALLEDVMPREGFRSTIESMRAEVREIDLSSIADGLGARYSDGRLYVNCLGRDFVVLDSGHLESACHVNVWVELMLLNYCRMKGSGGLDGRWISYGELPAAAPTAPYFEKRCEEPLRAIADHHTEVFLDLLEIFGGRRAEGFDADHAFVIHPLPKVPFLVLYTAAGDEGFDSMLRILFDRSVTSFVPKEALTYMGRGIVEMFKNIVSKHQRVTADLLSK